MKKQKKELAAGITHLVEEKLSDSVKQPEIFRKAIGKMVKKLIKLSNKEDQKLKSGKTEDEVTVKEKKEKMKGAGKKTTPKSEVNQELSLAE